MDKPMSLRTGRRSYRRFERRNRRRRVGSQGSSAPEMFRFVSFTSSTSLTRRRTGRSASNRERVCRNLFACRLFGGGSELAFLSRSRPQCYVARSIPRSSRSRKAPLSSCLGSTGIGRIAAAVLGSTAATVAERARCPVAIIRRTHDRPLPEAGFIAVILDGRTGNEEAMRVGHGGSPRAAGPGAGARRPGRGRFSISITNGLIDSSTIGCNGIRT